MLIGAKRRLVPLKPSTFIVILYTLNSRYIHDESDDDV